MCVTFDPLPCPTGPVILVNPMELDSAAKKVTLQLQCSMLPFVSVFDNTPIT